MFEAIAMMFAAQVTPALKPTLKIPAVVTILPEGAYLVGYCKAHLKALDREYMLNMGYTIDKYDDPVHRRMIDVIGKSYSDGWGAGLREKPERDDCERILASYERDLKDTAAARRK